MRERERETERERAILNLELEMWLTGWEGGSRSQDET